MVEEQKGVYFPRGTFIDVALKNSPKQELKDVYNLAEKLNTFMEYQRKYFCEFSFRHNSKNKKESIPSNFFLS